MNDQISSQNDAQSEAQSEPPVTEVPFAGLVRVMTTCEQALAAVLLFVILSVMGAHVFARYVFKSPFSWSEEFVRLTLIWMTFISAAFVMAEKRHITVDILSKRLSHRGKVWLECFSHFVVAGACLMLLIGGRHFVWHMSKVVSPSLEIPKIWWYSSVSVGMLLIAIHSIVNLLQVWTTGQPSELDSAANDDGFQLDMEQGE